jgi:hypothetical protein
MAEQDRNLSGPTTTSTAKQKQAVRLVYAMIGIMIGFLILIGGTIGTSLLISANNSRNINAQQHAFSVAQARLRSRVQESSIRTSIPTCMAIVKMDDASHGATFPVYPGAKAGEGYGEKLAGTIHNLAETSGCTKLIGLVDQGKTVAQIYAIEKGGMNHD